MNLIFDSNRRPDDYDLIKSSWGRRYQISLKSSPKYNLLLY
ncbi:MAG: hypothetical protein ACI8VZ_001628 [Candidatus Paceibacteria bacterium]